MEYSFFRYLASPRKDLTFYIVLICGNCFIASTLEFKVCIPSASTKCPKKLILGFRKRLNYVLLLRHLSFVAYALSVFDYLSLIVNVIANEANKRSHHINRT